jgi:hypothetical protein
MGVFQLHLLYLLDVAYFINIYKQGFDDGVIVGVTDIVGVGVAVCVGVGVCDGILQGSTLGDGVIVGVGVGVEVLVGVNVGVGLGVGGGTVRYMGQSPLTTNMEYVP